MSLSIKHIALVPCVAFLLSSVASAQTVTKSFGAPAIAVGGQTTLSFTLTNTQPVPLAGLAFTDTLPSGISIPSPFTVTGACGGGTIVANANSVTLSGAALAPSAACTFSVVVQGVTAGANINATGCPFSFEGGACFAGVPGQLPAAQGGTATINVVAPPTLTKAFGTGPIQTGGTTTLTFTITNPNGVAITGAAFTDTLPAGLIVGSPTGVNFGSGCVAGSSVTTSLSAISVSANLAAVGTCVITLNVTGVAGGVQTNTTGVITATGPAATTGGTASASITVIPSDVFQIKYFTLQFGGGVLNVTNVGSFFGGAAGIPPLDQATDPNGTLCANFYAFDPNEELVACCACKVTPNGLGSISVKEDILNNILINNPPSSITVKVLSTRGDTGFSCNAANPTLATLRGGLKLWGTTLHSISVQGSPAPPPLTGLTETEFARAELSLGELAKLTTYCRFVQILGSQITGICKACRSGALGGGRQ